jgi:hypothetical protein
MKERQVSSPERNPADGRFVSGLDRECGGSKAFLDWIGTLRVRA